MREVLFEPLSSGKLQYKTAVFDYRADSKINFPLQNAAKDAILIMEGVFLLRPELENYWDIKIFLDVDFNTVISRAIKRTADKEYIGAEKEIINKYKTRYIPGQKIYFNQARPKEKANIIIDNNDFENPLIKSPEDCFI